MAEIGHPLRIDIGARSDVGRVRKNNEDSYRLVPALNLFVLSDGMGGEAHGEIASAMATETVVRHCSEGEKNPSMPLLGETGHDLSGKTRRLASAVHLANRKIRESALSNPGQRGMGATILAAQLDGQRLSVVHVGDSRAYLLRDRALEQLTSDHSLVAELAHSGTITLGEAGTSAMESVLTRALGAEEEVEVEADERMLLDGDVLLLCSDGLTRMVSDAHIARCLLAHPEPQAAADGLVALANESGGADNVTVLLLRIAVASNGVVARLRRWAGRSPEAASS